MKKWWRVRYKVWNDEDPPVWVPRVEILDFSPYPRLSSTYRCQKGILLVWWRVEVVFKLK